MRNAVLPPLSSQFYTFGNNEINITNLDVSMDSKLMYGGSSSLDDDKKQLSGEIFVFPHQQYYKSDYQLISSNWENNSTQLQRHKVPAPQDAGQGFQSTRRKRSTNDIRSNCERGMTTLIQNVNEEKKSKRMKVPSSLEQSHYQENLKVPVRRSQKLSDKITALQKLVSPYGKTDTASVLEEASLYIKILQEQIQNLFQMLIKPSPLQNERIDGKMQEIQSRGLCLFPISVVQKLY